MDIKELFIATLGISWMLLLIFSGLQGKFDRHMHTPPEHLLTCLKCFVGAAAIAAAVVGTYVIFIVAIAVILLRAAVALSQKQ